MQVLHAPGELGDLPGPVFLAIGIFDGVHRGHQALIAEARADAEAAGGTAVVMTFEPHPMMFFQRSGAPLRLSSPRHKEVLLARAGVTHVLVVPFDGPRAAQGPEDFVEELRGACRPLGGICVGAEWRFGRGRSGDVALLERLGSDQGFAVDGISAVVSGGEPISSTAIRQAVARGDLPFAEGALGRPYSVLGPVVEGRREGRKLGFPTANIDTDGFQLPPDGVYEASVRCEGGRWRGVVNLGVRPTFADSSGRVLEVHLLGFDGDLYGRELEVEFLRFLRGERRFPSRDELQAQIARDIGAVAAGGSAEPGQPG
jgi:riboflavin kinase/FMN adenylyltransferase